MPISTSRVPPCGPQVILQEWKDGDTHSLDAARRTCPEAHRLFTYYMHTYTHAGTRRNRHRHTQTSKEDFNHRDIAVHCIIHDLTNSVFLPSYSVVKENIVIANWSHIKERYHLQKLHEWGLCSFAVDKHQNIRHLSAGYKTESHSKLTLKVNNIFRHKKMFSACDFKRKSLQIHSQN